MDPEAYLEKLKKDYLETKPPEALTAGGWLALKEQIEYRAPKQAFFTSFWPRGFAFASLTIVILLAGFFGTVKIAQAALPGEILYPVKRFSEVLLLVVTGDNQIPFDNRGQEIIDLSKQDGENSEVLKETVEDYKKSITEVKREIEKSDKEKNEFHEKLEKNEQDFQKVLEEKPELDKELEQAVEAARDGQKIEVEKEGNDRIEEAERRESQEKREEEQKEEEGKGD